jgi:6-phosphogluconate dehydrogenase (decarboxylating)
VQIGLVGLGRMGGPLARRLTKADHAVVGFDVSLDVLDQAGRAGRAESSTRDAIPVPHDHGSLRRGPDRGRACALPG